MGGRRTAKTGARPDVFPLLAGERIEDVLARMATASLPERWLHHFALLIEPKRVDDRLVKNRRLGQIRRINSDATSSTFELTTVPDEAGERTRVPFRFLRQVGTPLTVVAAVAPASEWIHLAKLLDHLGSLVFRPFLRQADMAEIFRSMQASLLDEFRVRLRRVSSARRLLQVKSRRRFSLEVAWTDLDPEDAFAQASESLSYFRSVKFEVCEGETTEELRPTGIEGVVTRDAHFATSSQAAWLFDTAVRPAIERARKDYEFSRHRGRAEPRPANTKPAAMVARFDEQVSLSKDDMPKLASLLGRMPHASVSILHGNPYLHAAVVDLRDGSSFDLLLVSERQMLILPQLRATEAAVTRVCSFIYDHVGEAEFMTATGT